MIDARFRARSPLPAAPLAAGLLAAALLAATALGGCRREPRRVTGSAATGAELAALDVSAFPTDAEVAARILRMPFDEVARRLGSLTYESHSFFVFNRGGEELEQTEVGRLTQDSTGNFHVQKDTGANQVELYVVGESVFVREDKGRLRRKPRREASTEAWRDLVWSGVQQTLGLFAPRLRFSDERPDTVAGRQAVRYRVALAPEGETGLALPPTPPSLPSTPTSRWRELAKPLAVSGNLWLDGATGVVLKVKLEGRLEVADRDVRPTQLTLRYEGTVSRPGSVDAIAPPESIPEYQRTPPPGDPIGFFRGELPAAPTGPTGTSAPARP